MKKINLNKFGFNRCEIEDFTDDGARFKCYTVCDDRIRVTYHRSNGMIYISARLNDSVTRKLNYTELSALKTYSALDELNGISENIIQDADLDKLYKACIEFINEYESKVKELAKDTPTRTQLMEVEMAVKNKRELEYGDITKRLNTQVYLKLNDYQMRNLMSAIKHLYQACCTNYSINYYLEHDGEARRRYADYKAGVLHELEDSYYYKSANEILESIGL